MRSFKDAQTQSAVRTKMKKELRPKRKKMCVIRIGSNRGNPRSKGPEVKSYIFVPALICFLMKDDKKAVVTRTPNRYHKKSCASSDATRIPVCLTDQNIFSCHSRSEAAAGQV